MFLLKDLRHRVASAQSFSRERNFEKGWNIAQQMGSETCVRAHTQKGT